MGTEEKLSFVDTEEQKLQQRAKDAVAKGKGKPIPPRKKEKSLTEVWEETNVLLTRIACALEGKVVEEKVVSQVTNNLTQALKQTSKETDKPKHEITVIVPKSLVKNKSDEIKPKVESVYIKAVRSQFFDEINNLLEVKEEGELVLIRTLGRLGTDLYWKANKAIEGLKGRRIEGEKDERGKWISYPYWEIKKRDLE